MNLLRFETLVFLLLLILSSSVRSEDAGHSEGEGGERASSPAELSQLKDRVRGRTGSEVWWDDAFGLLERFTRDEATQFGLGYSEPEDRTRWESLVEAHYDLSPDTLFEQQSDRGEVMDRELEYRRTQDPDVQLLSELFERRTDSAIRIEYSLRRAIEREDDENVSRMIAEHIYGLNDEGKDRFAERLSEEIKKPEVLARPRSRALVQRLLWGIEEIRNDARGSSLVEKRFKDAMKVADSKAREKAEKFETELDKAAKGDKGALKYLKDHYRDEDLLDYLSSQKGEVGRKIAESLGWRDVDGNLHLDLNKTGKATDPIETWTLGKKKKEIEESLQALDERVTVGGKEVPKLHTVKPVAPATGNVPSNVSQVPQRKFVKIDPVTKQPVEHDPKILPPEKKALCENAEEKLSSVKPQETPVYFFRPFADSQKVGYAGQSSQNYIKDLRTGAETVVPGYYDPVPTPDELFLTVPESSDHPGLQFYTMRSLKETDPKPFFVDKEMTGVYQSIGKLANQATDTYRVMIVESGGKLFFKDYEITAKPGMVGADIRLKERKALCPGFNLATPMISKDGTQLAALDLDTETTKLFNLSASGSCQEAVDLGIHTGKVDFSYDGKSLVFHKYNFLPSDPTGYISVPGDGQISNIYLYDKSSGDIKRLTHNTNSNAVYPAFRRDGTVMYMNHQDGAGGGDEVLSSFVTLDPNKVSSQPLDFFNQPDQKDRLEERAAIGTLWSELCSSGGADKDSAVLSTLDLSADECSSMVGDYWDEFKGDLQLNLDKDKILKRCGELSTQPAPNAPPGGGVRPGEGDVVARCIACHASSRFPLPLRNPAQLSGLQTSSAQSNANGGPHSLVSEIRTRLRLPVSDPRHMPPCQPSTEEQGAGCRTLTEEQIQAIERLVEGL